MSPQFDEMLRSLRARVDAYLPETLAMAGGPARLREAMTYSVMAPGKRLRPILVLLSTTAVGGSLDFAMPAAAAVELIHTYSLIHDDLPAMDDDDMRRGRPTCHKQYDEAIAILAGDALLTLAFQILSDRYSAVVAAACVCELARGAGAAGMVGGQVEDLAGENEPAASVEQLERIHRQKTGALFRASLRMGARVAQADGSAIDHLDRFGSAIGLAFQITDDLLDVQGAADLIGKRVGKDAARGKLTYPGLLGIDESRRRAALAVSEAVAAVQPFGKPGEPLAALAGYLIDRDR